MSGSRSIDFCHRSPSSPPPPQCFASPSDEPTNSWVAQQQKEAPNTLWAAGARSYCEHAAGLAKEFGDVLSASGDGGKGEGDKQPSAKKAKPAAPAAADAAAPAAPSAAFGGGGLFGSLGGGAAAAGTTATFNFGSSSAAAAPPAAASSLFGAPPPAAAGGGAGLFGAPPTGTFNFGGGAPAAAAGGFGFGGPGGAVAAAAADADDGEAEEEEEATETVLDGGATILFKEKAKLHTQGPDKKWVDRGAGVLTVRAPSTTSEGAAAAPTSSSKRPYLVFTTDSGRVLLNAACYRGLAAMKARKPHMVTASLANAAEKSSGEGRDGVPPQISPTLFNLFAEGAADKFVAVLKEAASK